MRTPLRTLFIIALLALLAACSKVTVENYNKIKVGMSYAEVEQILGKPDKCSDLMTARNCNWGDARSYVNVSFVGDKVVLFGSENIR